MAYERQADLTTSLGRPRSEILFARLNLIAFSAFALGGVGWYFGGPIYLYVGLALYLLVKTGLAWLALISRRQYAVYRSRALKDWVSAIATTLLLIAYLWFVIGYAYPMEFLFGANG